jgi:hypothetical protein
LTGDADPYSPYYTGPFNSIVVKVTDLCPTGGNENWCGQTTSKPVNQYGKPVQRVFFFLRRFKHFGLKVQFIQL